MNQYKHYKHVEKRLYNYGIEQARRAVLLAERKSIIDQVLPSVGVAQYGEHIGRASDVLTGPEQIAEQCLKQGNRLWWINREVDAIEARCHIIDYAVAVLNANERDIVKARYFDGCTMERVAEICCYSLSQCKRIRYDAILSIGQVLFGE
jgi:hypothetical protein